MLRRTLIRCGAVALPERRHRDEVVRGHRIHVVETGPEDGIPVLCIPGALGTAVTDFEHQLNDLPDEGFRVVSFDPRGYGKSRPGRREYPRDFYHVDAEDAVSLMRDKLGIPVFNLMGWSDGANASVILAAKHPETVDRLVIFGGNSYVTGEDIVAYENTRNVQRTWSPAMKAKHGLLYGRDLQPMWDAFCDAMLMIYRDGGDICQREAKALKCPTLILHGAMDVIVPAEHPKWFERNIDDAAIYYFEEGKHNIHQKFHMHFNALVTQFIKAGREDAGAAEA